MAAPARRHVAGHGMTVVSEWFRRIVAPYDRDPRPLEMDNPHNGDLATVFGDEDSSLVVVHKPAIHAAGAQSS